MTWIPAGQPSTLTTNILRSISISYRNHAFALDWYLIDIDSMVFVIRFWYVTVTTSLQWSHISLEAYKVANNWTACSTTIFVQAYVTESQRKRFLTDDNMLLVMATYLLLHICIYIYISCDVGLNLVQLKPILYADDTNRTCQDYIYVKWEYWSTM